MHYARIMLYTARPELSDESIRRARTGLAPLFHSLPGFVSYTVVKGTEDRGVSISLWETKENAELALKKGEEWFKANMDGMVQPLETYVGTVQLEENSGGRAEALVRELYEAFNAKKWDRVKALCHPEATMLHVPYGETVTIEEDFRIWAGAFPDARADLRSVICEGNQVAIELIGSGTHKGRLELPNGTFEPTGRHLELRFAEVFEIRDGKIASGRSYFDVASLVRQMSAGAGVAGRRDTSQPEARH